MTDCILIEAHFGFFGIDVLVGSRNHLTNPRWWLVVELGAEATVMESSDEGSDDLSFRDVGNRIPHLGKMSDVATEELGRFQVDAIQIMHGAWPSAHSLVVVGEDLLDLFLGSDRVWGEACEPVHGGWCEHDEKIVCHDTSVSSGGADSSGISL